MADEEVEVYICDLLVGFLHREDIFAMNECGLSPAEYVIEMLPEGDIRLEAASFEQERDVHKHIGDFLLFWSGVFPEFLKSIRHPAAADTLLDPVRQGSFSYYVASTFDYGDFAREAPVLRKLSAEFEAYMLGLSLVRAEYLDLSSNEWKSGFEA